MLLLVCIATAANAGSKIPYGGAFREEIEAVFFELDGGDLGRVSSVKVRAYRDFIEKKLRALETHVYNHETIELGRSDADAKAKIRKADTTIALEHILHLLDRMEREADPAAAYGIAAEALMVEFATRSYTDPLASIKIPVHIKNMIFEWRMGNETRPRAAAREASNLVDPETGEFYTPDELAALTRSGFDISELKAAEEALAKSEAKWRSILENAVAREAGLEPAEVGLIDIAVAVEVAWHADGQLDIDGLG